MTTEANGRQRSTAASRSHSRHIAIIMDGNGRWARRGVCRALAGHRAGTENIRRVLRRLRRVRRQDLTIYAFSTENWGRPEARGHGPHAASWAR